MSSGNPFLRLPLHWPRLLDSIERPESALEWCGSEDGWDAYLTELWGNGLFPLAYRSWREENVLERLPEPARAEAEAGMTRYRAGSAASWAEIEKLLALFLREGFQPVPLKGTHLAIRYYPEVHLRPISDLDVLFPTLDMADKAFDMLVEEGFQVEPEGIEGDNWDKSHHRSGLVSSESGFRVEVHGSLIYTPHDRRWKGRAERLIEQNIDYSYNGLKLRGLKPEANAVFLCAHTFMQHAADPPKASVFYDLKFLLADSQNEFDWDSMCYLAGQCDVEAHVAKGMHIIKDTGAFDVPEGVFDQIGGSIVEAGLSRQALEARKSILRIAHASSPMSSLRIAWNIVVPTRKFLRERYPERSSWPVLLLYPYRWYCEAVKICKWIAGFVARKRSKE